MGRTDNAWTVNGWAVFMTVDDKVEERQMLWDKLGQLLQGIPRRNLLVIGADRELAGLLAVHQLAAEDAVALDLGLVPWRMEGRMDQDAKPSVAQAELDQVFGGARDQPMAEPRQGSGSPRAGRCGRSTHARWGRATTGAATGPGGGESGAGRLDKATQKLIQSMVKLSLRHEAELGRLRSETGFVLLLDTPTSSPELSFLPKLGEIVSEWTTKFTNGTVTSSLRIILVLSVIRELKTHLADFMKSEEKVEKAKLVGWLSEGRNSLDPVWHYFAWDPKEKKQHRTEQHPVKTTDVQQNLDLLERHMGSDGVTLNFKSAGEIPTEFTTEVIPFMLTISLRSQQATLCYQILQQLSGNAVTKILSTRIRPERLARQAAAKQVEESYLGVSGKSPEAAFYWIGELSSSPDASYGRIKVLTRWPNPLQQHDAGEYIRHFLDEVQPEAYEGQWQARISDPHQFVDEGFSLLDFILTDIAVALADRNFRTGASEEMFNQLQAQNSYHADTILFVI
ncbi:Pol, partial [Symbiodinium sp. KB8]